MDVEPRPAAVLSLLRGFALTVDRKFVPLVWSAQRLVAFLALYGRPVGRAHVAEALWPETTMRQAGANLRTALWRAQRSCRQLVTASVHQLVLDPDVVVDIRRAEIRAHLLLDSNATCTDILTSATQADLSADLLPDWYDDDWVLVEREQYHHLRLHALEAMCARLTSTGRFGEAVEAGLAAVHGEPLRESAHHILIKAHLAAGNRCEAARQYERCRRLLLDELGLEPAPALRSLLPVPPSGPDAGVAVRHRSLAGAVVASPDRRT
jgi:DNA-binding SARP family transcriptional activator